MLFQYWPTANGTGPTLKQHRVKSLSLQGELSAFGYTRAVCVWLEQATQSSLYPLMCSDNYDCTKCCRIWRPCSLGIQRRVGGGAWVSALIG